MIQSAPRIALVVLALPALAGTAAAQFNNEWVEFTQSTGTLVSAIGEISSVVTEVDFAWGDLDQNGRDDLVIVRKEVFTSAGKRPNVLFMNENGILIDRTSQFASASDVVGDNGFLTPTNDRDVDFVDVDMDGWLDVVTATTLSDGDTKEIGHPRIYINLGNDLSGNWLGLRYEASRIPQLIQYTTGLPENPRFCSVAFGDLTGDGAPELYFGDYDSSGAGGVGQPANLDLNNRLLVNDGNGFFTDQSQSRMNATMLLSAFGATAEIADVNCDGVNDVIKQTALQPPQHVAIVYNNPASEGFFNIYHDFSNNEPYHVNQGDLNQDGRIDLVVSSDNQDRYFYNRGNDALGRVIWSPALTFLFLTGSDDGFASNNIIADLDNDGWNDAIFADVDVDIGGFNRRIHIYHNPGGVPGSEPTLVEERETSAAGGWLGVKGILDADLRGGHDVAPMDIDGDGDLDLVIGRGQGLFSWINQTVPNILLQDAPLISLASGGAQNMQLRAGATHAGELYWVLGTLTGTTPGFGGLPLNFDNYFLFTLNNPNTLIQNQIGFLNGSGAGTATFALPPGLDPGLAGATFHHAYAAIELVSFGVTAISNPVPLTLIP